MESLPLVNLNKQEGQTRHEILLPFFPYTFFRPLLTIVAEQKRAKFTVKKGLPLLLASSLAAE